MPTKKDRCALPKGSTTYKLIGVRGDHVVEGKTEGSPSEAKLCNWGRQRGRFFVIRYFPSRRGWRILDIRKAIAVTMRINGRPVPVWRGQVRGTKYYATEEAAVMVAIHKQGCLDTTSHPAML